MDYRDRLIAAVSERALRLTAARIRRALQRMGAMLRGDDSGLSSVWDEYCAQVHGEHSVFIAEYEQVVEQVAVEQLSRLPREEQAAIWLQTDAASAWEADAEDYDGPVPVDVGDMVELVLEEVRTLAANHSNRRLERFLRREFD
ncbi:MAG: hypothetical protein AMXMBFR57_17750 [Acidimicrobiia bacterium]